MDFGNLSGRHGRRGLLGQPADELPQHLPHPLPILDRSANIGEHDRQTLGQGREIGPVRRADLDLHPRFADPRLANVAEPSVVVARHRQDRMNDQMDDPVTAIDRPRNRIDKERHVVIDDLDDRVRRRPAVRIRVRVKDPDLRLALPPPLGEAP